ncbi:A/G-specific adenine glycosylase [Thermosphaera aggregans]|nr:A/G-specific adenine glycosylase [Thermosphaera aggregans]
MGSAPRSMDVTEEKIEFFRRKVVDFYLTQGRKWPWRETRDPYVVLITELLLQKTTAKQVVKVFSSFFSKFPNIGTLAKASETDIEAIIGELGLRKRAGFLRELAQHAVEEFGDKIPNTLEDLMKLKGVGLYTANAVRSFAYGMCVPVVDRNVARVLRRFFGLEGEKPAYADRELWKFAEKIMPTSACREFNYGLIDLGAMICTSREPQCSRCPLRPECAYFPRH